MYEDPWQDAAATNLWFARWRVTSARMAAEQAGEMQGLAEDLFCLECWLEEVVSDLRTRKRNAKRQLQLPIC